MSGKLTEIAEDSARGGFFLFTGNVSQLIILAISNVIITRLIGPENAGLLYLSLIVPSILVSFIDLGVNSALTMFSAKLRAEGKPQLAAGILKSGLLFKFILSSSVFVVCFVFSDALATYILKRPEMGSLLKLALPLILFQTIFLTLSSVFIGLDKTEGNALIMNTQSIAKTALSLLLVVLGFSAFGALAGHVISYLIAGFAGSLIFYKYYKGLGKSSSNSFSTDLKTMLRYGFPLYLSAMLSFFINQYQTIVLAFFASNLEIGNFSVAINLSALVNVLIFPLSVLFPAFSKINPNGNELKKIFKLSVKYTSLFVIPATVIVAILSKNIVYTLYGNSFDLAPSFLSLYILLFLYVGAGSIILVYFFSGIGETRVIFKSYMINLLVFLPLAPVLTMFYGVPGLIIAFLISNLLFIAYKLSVAIKKFKVNIDVKASLRIYLASFLSAIPILIILYFSPFSSLLNLIITGPLFLITYLTLTPLIGAITRTDLENLKPILRKIKILWPFLKPLLSYEAKLISIRP